MNVKIKSEDELIERFAQAVHIMRRLRYWTEMWHTYHGSYYLKRKKEWEERRDLFLEEIKASSSEADDSKIVITISEE